MYVVQALDVYVVRLRTGLVFLPKDESGGVRAAGLPGRPQRRARGAARRRRLAGRALGSRGGEGARRSSISHRCLGVEACSEVDRGGARSGTFSVRRFSAPQTRCRFFTCVRSFTCSD